MIPSSGQNGLSRFDSLRTRLPRRISSGIGARSRCTSLASLSSRRPWYTGARSRPSCVHSAKRTSATSRGSTQTTSPFRTFGIFGTSANGGSSVRSGFSLSSSRLISASSKPVPTLPAQRRPLPSLTASTSEPKAPVRLPCPFV